MNKTPLGSVKERFSSKDKLVEAVEKLATEDLWLDRLSGNKGLGRVSNSKLLKLHDVLTTVKKDFGSRDALVAAILKSEKRDKDAGYKSRLDGYPLPRLLDHYRGVTRRAKRIEEKQKAEPKPKAAKAAAKPKAVAKKPAAAKKAPAKKPARAKS